MRDGVDIVVGIFTLDRSRIGLGEIVGAVVVLVIEILFSGTREAIRCSGREQLGEIVPIAMPIAI